MTVTFLGTPTHIGRHTFSDSDNLQKIVIPKGATEKFAKALNYNTEEDFLFETGNSADDAKDYNLTTSRPHNLTTSPPYNLTTSNPVYNKTTDAAFIYDITS